MSPRSSDKKNKRPVERLFYRPPEAAEALSVSVSRVYELINKGIVPAVRLGGTLRVPVEGLKRLGGSDDPETS